MILHIAPTNCDDDHDDHVVAPNNDTAVASSGGARTCTPTAATLEALPSTNLANFASAVNAMSLIQEGMRKQESKVLKPPSEMAKVFVCAIRDAVLTNDEPKGLYDTLRITPCMLDETDDAFTQKASNFMDMCSTSTSKPSPSESHDEAAASPAPVEERTGHIKIEQAFRPKGSFMEGWLYVRWCEIGWRSAGFKGNRLGSLPLVIFSKDDDNEALKETLDGIMEEVYPALVHYFPHCFIVPVKSCEEQWNAKKPKASADACKLQDAILRAQQSKRERGGSETESNSGEFRVSAGHAPQDEDLEAGISSSNPDHHEESRGCCSCLPKEATECVWPPTTFQIFAFFILFTLIFNVIVVIGMKTG